MEKKHTQAPHPLVMGILNVTPDSFFDGGRSADLDTAVQRGIQLAAEGADILDIGGESTRPGATPVALETELARVIPVIKALKRVVSIPLSVDTYKPEVMQVAIDAGVDMINDVRALQEPTAVQIVAQSTVRVCLMHMQGRPNTMQIAPHYANALQEIRDFLHDRMQFAQAHGIAKSRILLDPGFGFGKTLADNFSVLQQLTQLADLGVPLLIGVSRKSMLRAVVGEQHTLVASITAALWAVQHGASIVRTHDVAETVAAFKTLLAIKEAA